ncbi:Retrovirus-related Pol polyprotein from transposon TNT 1-94 [Dendrobium catenatum]|uniref:Retrovirus-related Pol polyprotein from transposon TNT 1-94 n=1 Tax=Dendrobium catenatum TaxID=906689 RepID=A0A2I0VH93_9ASPA|nr:Retrovirus-related Pol polyprotein from transposon TNT 1-94 [Dendrobium catenatum]
MVKVTTIKIVLSMILVEDLHLEHIDVKTTYLHGDLGEELYMMQPQGYVVICNEVLVCRLRRSL